MKPPSNPLPPAQSPWHVFGELTPEQNALCARILEVAMEIAAVGRDPDVADDLAQLATIRATPALLARGANQGDERAFQGYIRNAVDMVLMERRRKERRRSQRNEVYSELVTTVDAIWMNSHRLVNHDDLERFVRKTVEDLPPRQQAVYCLREEGVAYEEFAPVLGITPEHARNLYHIARRTVEEKVAKYLAEGNT